MYGLEIICNSAKLQHFLKSAALRHDKSKEIVKGETLQLLQCAIVLHIIQSKGVIYKGRYTMPSSLFTSLSWST